MAEVSFPPAPAITAIIARDQGGNRFDDLVITFENGESWVLLGVLDGKRYRRPSAGQ